jgi:hypothetical protein
LTLSYSYFFILATASCSSFFAYEGFVMINPLGIINGPIPICGIPAMLIFAILSIWLAFSLFYCG